ncbi:MAG: trypsin-like peptidase domain-containing protein [Thermoanaerobaculia bacterium]
MARSSRRRTLRGGLSAGLLVAAFAPGPPAAGEPSDGRDLDWLRRQTVRIQVLRDNGEENGSGVVLCTDADRQVHVLTARHVLFGESPSGGLGSLLDVSKIRISFFKDVAPAVEEIHSVEDLERHDVITKIPVPGKDLLLLSFQVPADLAATASPGRAPSAADLPAQEGPRVVAVGYSQERAESWSGRTGALLRRESDLLIHDAPIGEGFSGGPLFDEAGALIGINVEVAETDAGREGRALPIEQVLAALDKWVPASCLKNEDRESEALRQAHDAYREAMAAVSRRAWKAARAHLERAVELQPLEGGSVHLQGMRYTDYLPRYHLGLVLFHSQEYSAALRAFAISEVQGAIRTNKRFKKLKKLRALCRERLKDGAAGAP